MQTLEPFEKSMYVTEPLLPDISDVVKTISEIWDSKQLTNTGNMARLLEGELVKFLKTDYISLFSNGTVALQIACKILRLSGEVITTPFTFAATPHSLSWNGITPVFCDIDKETFNINPDCIEPLITPRTTAILPVHVFGNPCETEKIKRIADQYGLKVLYDSAHAFGVEAYGKPISSFGDISMFSFHATKIFHTIEGGALTFNNPHYKERADQLKNFGLKAESNIMEPGTNGKLNEVQAGIGMLVIKLIQNEISRRKEITYLYRSILNDVQGIKTSTDMEGVTHNYPYFIIYIDKENFGLSRDELDEKLKKYNIFGRKYFYPLCSDFTCYRDLPSSSANNLSVAKKVASSVLALPLHGRLTDNDVIKICEIIKYIQNSTHPQPLSLFK
jgi:dTDP-4-amino-4,6-dideoxygalactose transaminase